MSDKNFENILITIQDQLPTMSEVYKKIAHYILDNQEQIPRLSISDLAEASKVSEAGVSRFAKYLGFTGYKELKLELIQAPSDSRSLLSEISPKDSAADLKDKLLLRIQHSLSLTNQDLSEDLLDKVVKMLSNSEVIHIFGIGASNLVAQDLFQKFNRIGKLVMAPPDAHQVLTYLTSHGEHQTLILISDSGLTREILTLAQAAKDYGVSLIALSSNLTSVLVEMADIFVPTNGGQRQVNMRTASTTSLLSQLYAVDLIFYRYLQSHFSADTTYISESHKVIRKYFK